VVWSRSVGTAMVIEAATRSASTGAWTPPTRVVPTGADALAPSIAVDKRGDGVIVWTSSDKSGLALLASYRRPGKAWGAPVVLSAPAPGPLAPQVALDSRGDALVVWTRPIGGFSRVLS